jgi:CheY-like chemotaxis protein
VGRILVVDDHPEFRQATIRLLERGGHTADGAADGAEGLRAFLERPPDLVITDLFMPDTDGLEFIRALGRSRPGTRVIAVSGGGFMEASAILEVARTLGAIRTLTKPVDPPALLALVDELLGAER